MRFPLLLVFVLLAHLVLSQSKRTVIPQSDTARVLYYDKLSDSLYRAGNDSLSLVYLKEAVASLQNVPNGAWRIKRTINFASDLYNSGEIRLSEKYFNQAMELAGKTDSLLLADARNRAGEYFTNRGNYSTALDLLKKAARTYDTLNATTSLAEVYLRIGIVFDDQGSYEQSLTYYFKANSLYQSIHDTVGMGYVLNNVAITYARQKDFLSAVENYTKALNIYEQRKDTMLVINTKINLGVAYKNLGAYAKADQFFRQALEYYDVEKDNYALAVVWHNLGELMAKQHRTKEALDCYARAQLHASAIDAREIMASTYKAMASVHLESGATAQCIKSCAAGLAISEALGLYEMQRDIHKILSGAYRKNGEYRKALDEYDQYAMLNDSLMSETRTRQMDQMKAQFEVFQKDAEINRLRTEKELQEKNHAVQKTLNRYLLTGGAGLLLLIGLLVLVYLRTRTLNHTLRSQKKLLTQQHDEIQTSQKELTLKNESLIRLNSEKDEIIAMVSHDLRSPLNQIKGLVFLIRNEPRQTFTVNSDEYLSMINGVTDNMKNRINRMLNVEALNEGKINLNMEQVSAHDIIVSVANNFDVQAREKNIALVVDGGRNAVYIKADKNYLLQVYENLVSNALKFSPFGKSIWLKLSGQEDHVLLHVKDQGPGIHPAEHDRLFSKYQSLSARPTDGEESTGLGLAIVKKYVEAMNGRVWCESAPGAGAEFIVELPRAR